MEALLNYFSRMLLMQVHEISFPQFSDVFSLEFEKRNKKSCFEVY